jgi:2-polyprenyl-3-methyl-5-hydroxy-6-metoxy-1,4-benzoquinol methylase
MHLIKKSIIEQYLKDDTTKKRLAEFSEQVPKGYVCEKWLEESPAKRYIYEALYGPLLSESSEKTILDVGGGITSLTQVLASSHNYFLVDLLAHEQIENVAALEKSIGREFIIPNDWETLDDRSYDTIIANDLFPNVDQRLESFLNKFIPRCSRLKMLLTWYNTPRYYKTKRIDGEEIMFLLAWDGEQIRKVLEAFLPHIVNPDLGLFDQPHDSVYPNGRRTCLIEFQGGI